jgi:hypothetical protein
MSNKEKEVDDLKKGIDYMRMRINVLEGRTPLDFGVKRTTQEDHEVVASWLDEPMESFNKRWNPETMKAATDEYTKAHMETDEEYLKRRAKADDVLDNIEYYTNIAKAEGREVGEFDEDGIPL